MRSHTQKRPHTHTLPVAVALLVASAYAQLPAPVSAPPAAQAPTSLAQPTTSQMQPLSPQQLPVQANPVPPAANLPLSPDPQVPPISGPAAATPPSLSSAAAAEAAVASSRLAPRGLSFHLFGLVGPYRSPAVPELFPGAGARLSSLVRDGKLFLSLHDAIDLALENNPDLEISRYNLALADTDRLRAAGGGSLRGIDYTVNETPAGVGGPGSPLLNSTANSPNPITPAVTDLTSLNSTTPTTLNLSLSPAATLTEPGNNIPLFDPQFILTGGYLRRSNTDTLVSTAATGTGTTGTATGTETEPQPLHFIAANLAYLQGWSPGTQLTAIVNNDSQVIYGGSSQSDPFYSPSTSVTLTQPLLRGRGREVNLRYLRVANLNRRVSRLLFEQQVLDTVYGVSRLYYDLVSQGENVDVKREALRAATKLEDDDRAQVEQGTLAPIELTRVSALRTSSEFDLTQASGLYRQQEVILRNQLIRTGSPVFSSSFAEIVATDRIVVPPTLDTFDLPALVQQGLARRPDITQADLQVQADQVSARAARNQLLPQLNLYANAETRGVTEQSYDQLGSPGTGVPTLPQAFALGGLRTSTIYQAGVQLTLPVRNRIAASDAARDTIQVREAQARQLKLQEQVREDIENGVIAVQTAFAAYTAATKSRDYPAVLLQAERDRLEVGQSTQLLIVQDESFLAQARSTEIAARSNYEKARIALDHALGTLLEQNGIQLDQAIQGTLPQP